MSENVFIVLKMAATAIRDLPGQPLVYFGSSPCWADSVQSSCACLFQPYGLTNQNNELRIAAELPLWPFCIHTASCTVLSSVLPPVRDAAVVNPDIGHPHFWTQLKGKSVVGRNVRQMIAPRFRVLEILLLINQPLQAVPDQRPHDNKCWSLQSALKYRKVRD